MWTRFMDMHSGGGNKIGEYEHIYIEAPQDEAEVIFQNRFGRSPHRVTCTCCGEDYSLSEEPTLEKASAYDRNCRWIEDERGWKPGKQPDDYREGRYIEADESVPDGYRVRDSYRKGTTSLSDYIKQKTVLVIRADEIKPEERRGEVRTEGYVWAD